MALQKVRGRDAAPLNFDVLSKLYSKTLHDDQLHGSLVMQSGCAHSDRITQSGESNTFAYDWWQEILFLGGLILRSSIFLGTGEIEKSRRGIKINSVVTGMRENSELN